MTTENELEKVKTKLEYTLSVLICADVKGANASLQHAKEEVIEALESLSKYTERLNSEALVEEVALAIAVSEIGCLSEGEISIAKQQKICREGVAKGIYDNEAKAAISTINNPHKSHKE